MKYLLTLLLTLSFLSCSDTKTRSEVMEEMATEYLRLTTPNMDYYAIVGRDTESKDSVFIGFVGYLCTMERHYSTYKVVFVGMHGEKVVYVGTSEEAAKRITNI